jgi:hypothetical protein
MTSKLFTALLALVAGSGCRQVLTSTGDYEPQKAGSVDQAMCLLGFTAVPLRELLTGHHLVEAKLNGKAASFVLDTGANATVLHAPFAAEFGLSGKPIGGAGAIGLGGAIKASQVRIKSLEIGGMPIRRDRLLTTDLAQVVKLLGPMSGGTIYGIIGQDVMKEHRAVIDVAKPILYLVRADKDPAPVPPEQCTEQAALRGSSPFVSSEVEKRSRRAWRFSTSLEANGLELDTGGGQIISFSGREASASRAGAIVAPASTSLRPWA